MNSKRNVLVVVALALLVVVPVAGCRRAKPAAVVSDVQVAAPTATTAAATGRTVVPVASPSPTSEDAPEATATPTPEAANPTPLPDVTDTPFTAPTPTTVSTTAPTNTPTTAPMAAPTATPTAVPTEPTSAGGGTHVVQPGENLFRISLHYGLHYQTVAAANGIVNPNLISVGQRLTIPSNGETQVTPGGSHVVQAGENLYRIALSYGVTVESLAVANNIGNVNLIHPGQRLVIP